MNIIIADDEPLVRAGLANIVDWNAHGYTIIGEADNGARALDLCRSLRPDIMFLDMKMPVCSGLDVLRTLKDEHSPTRCIILSSYSDFTLVKEAMRLGASDYILKLELDAHDILTVTDRVRSELLHPQADELQTPLDARTAARDFAGHLWDALGTSRAYDDTVIESFLSLCRERYGADTVPAAMTTEIAAALTARLSSTALCFDDVCPDAARKMTGFAVSPSIGRLGSWLDAMRKELVAYHEEARLPQVVLRAKNHIDTHYDERLSLSHVAQIVGINQFYLSTLMSRHLGMSFTDYVNTVRIKHARELIRTTDKKMYEIAILVGYRNEYYFSKVFKRISGVTPIHCKRESRDNVSGK